MTRTEINKCVQALKEYAKSKGYKVVYREKKTNTGDFTFFIYKNSGGSYLVGWDGDWNGEGVWSWESCYLATMNYLKNNV